MNLKSLEYFMEVAKDLNMTTAAQRLYISQQALSAQIQKLEQHYGVELFKRQPRLQLTFAGEQLLEGARRILQESNAITNSLSDISQKRAGVLRVGIPSYRAQECFPLILPTFTRKWPNVTISLDESTSKDVLERICEGSLDAGVVPPTAAEMQLLGDRIEFIFLMDDSTYLICSDTLLRETFGSQSESLKKKALQGTDLREFQDLPYLLHKPPMRLRKVADDCFNHAGFRPRVFMESSNTELMIALYPCHGGAFFVRRSRLRSIRHLYPDCNAFPVQYAGAPVQFPIYFVRRKTQRTPAHMQDFQKLMQDAWKTIAES